MWYNNHPTEDCEAFILTEMLEDADGFQKGDIVMSTDWYNAEQDIWFGLKDYQKVVMWQPITFPPVPREYVGRVQATIHSFSTHSIEIPERKSDYSQRKSDYSQRKREFPTGGIMFPNQHRH